MNKKKPLVFAVVDQAVRSAFHADLARYLNRTQGAVFHHYVPTDHSSEANRKRYTDAYESFNTIDKGETPPVEPADVEGLLRRAKYYEERYGVPLGYFRIIDRAIGLGFSLGGYYHPQSRAAERASEFAALANTIRELDFWEKEIAEKQIDVVINGFYFEFFPAKAQGKGLRSIISARNENYYYWSDTCFGELTTLEATFQRTLVPTASIQLNDAPVLNRKQLNVIAGRTKFSDMLARIGRQLYRYAYWAYKSRLGDHYRFSLVIGSIWREWRVLRALDREKLPRLADISGKPYVLYALQVEPESNFQGYSPEYFYQLSAISSLARDMPAGTWLVVKEHMPAAGRRPDLFHEQIKLFKNVIFVEPRESGLELVRNARAVATITGSVGHEAAVMGKPVISFGRHALYGMLPHVKVIRDEAELFPALKWALSDKFDAARAKENGQRYLAAFREHCFAMDDFGFHNPHGYTEAAVAAAADQLMQSMQTPSRVEPAAGDAAAFAGLAAVRKQGAGLD